MSIPKAGKLKRRWKVKSRVREIQDGFIKFKTGTARANDVCGVYSREGRSMSRVHKLRKSLFVS